MKSCVVCGKEFFLRDIESDLRDELCERADCLGEESLTEAQQCYVRGAFCSDDCYYDCDVS